MKPLCITFFFFLLLSAGFAQPIPADSLYLGQTPPGDSAIIFAPGTISLPNRRETKIVFSPNNEECLIGIGINNTFQIQYTDFYSGYWKDPVPAYFITNSRPIEPFFSPDSLHVFFTSYADIYWSARADQTWQAPDILGSPVNTGFEEYHPTTAMNGTLYYCSMLDDSNLDIYCSPLENGNYSTIEKLDMVINRHTTEQNGAWDPFIAHDESYIIFTSIRPDGYGQEDQYISYNRNGIWTNPKNLGPTINTSGIEYGSNISPDGQYYFFSRPAGWGPNTAADIYWIKIDELIASLMCTNFAPYNRNPVPDQTAFIGYQFIFTVPDSTFIDDDGNHTLTYDANLTNGDPLPMWMDFDKFTGTFSGIPPVSEILDISVTATDTAGASVWTSFKIIADSSTSVYKPESTVVSIFPNPGNGMFHIALDKQSDKKASFEIYTLAGLLVQRNEFYNEIKIDLTQRHNGIYIIKLHFDNEISVRKISLL